MTNGSFWSIRALKYYIVESSPESLANKIIGSTRFDNIFLSFVFMSIVIISLI